VRRKISPVFVFTHIAPDQAAALGRAALLNCDIAATEGRIVMPATLRSIVAPRKLA
jgi:hypothetical protein